jgi:hypothetical protein
MPLADHPSFPQPKNPTLPVWRYLDTPKLLSLLLRREIYLRRLDLLPDKFEGTHPKLTWELIRQQLAKEATLTPEQVRSIVADMGGTRGPMRRINYASCWCLQEHESEAMWRLYCGVEEGVALVLPYSGLKASLDDPSTYIGAVTYLDYETQVFPIGNTFNPAMHKRREFAYEHEVRIVAARMPPKPIVEWTEADLPSSIALPWDPESNLARIVVSPYAPEWYLEIVRETVRKIAPALAERVVASAMTAGPY